MADKVKADSEVKTEVKAKEVSAILLERTTLKLKGRHETYLKLFGEDKAPDEVTNEDISTVVDSIMEADPSKNRSGQVFYISSIVEDEKEYRTAKTELLKREYHKMEFSKELNDAIEQNPDDPFGAAASLLE